MLVTIPSSIITCDNWIGGVPTRGKKEICPVISPYNGKKIGEWLEWLGWLRHGMPWYLQLFTLIIVNIYNCRLGK